MKHAVIIGAGIGGLASAVLLANRGFQVSVLEKNSTVGGKMNQVRENGYRFDTGPSLLTMPFLLENLFQECGKNLDDYLIYEELEPLCRYIYPDGTIFDNFADRNKTEAQIANFAPEDSNNYSRFLDRSEEIYNKTADAFLFNPLYNTKDLLKVNPLKFLDIDAFSTVSSKVDEYVSSPYLRQFFKRFTTYNGSSPFQAPATLNVIPHVELNQGGYYVKGGLYKIAEALYQLAESLGVTFQFNSEVDSIDVKFDEATAVILKDKKQIYCDLIFSNSDATETIVNLLPNDAVSTRKKKKQQTIEPSCSGFVLMLGCKKQWNKLKHHNIFFSADYEKEFSDIFDEQKLPDDPTIYVANTSYSDSEHAPKNSSNLFILINAPYLSDGQNWESLSIHYSDFIIKELKKRGLDGLRDSIEYQKIISPKDFYDLYRSNRGSIYGTSSNSKFAAFIRPRNKLRGLKNLYMVGGSTHPGGGIPLVVQSAFNAVALLDREMKR